MPENGEKNTKERKGKSWDSYNCSSCPGPIVTTNAQSSFVGVVYISYDTFSLFENPLTR